MTNYTTLGGRVSCTQCNAQSKRTKLQCRAPAIKGKTKCRFHGGWSTGAKTAEGRARIAAAHTVHGRETRAKRAERSAKLAASSWTLTYCKEIESLFLSLIADFNLSEG